MQKALHIRTTVLPGGKIEFASPELDAGQTVDMVTRIVHREGPPRHGNPLQRL